MRDTDCINVEYDRKVSNELLDNLDLMIDDQISYHASSQKRYRLIVERLRGFDKAFFFIGFIFVLLRGILQLTLVPIGSAIHLDVELKSFIKSAANMLALVLPAWASYFTAKLSLCNFKGLLDRNELMIENLRAFKNTIIDLKNQAKPSYESIYRLSHDVYKLLTGDVRNWYTQMSSRSFTKNIEGDASRCIYPARIQRSMSNYRRTCQTLRKNWLETRMKCGPKSVSPKGGCTGLNATIRPRRIPALFRTTQLPENEKDYDRNSAMETIKLIIALGYKIEFLQGV